MAILLPDADNQTSSRYGGPHILTSPDGLSAVYTKPTRGVDGIAVPMLWISKSDGSNAYPLNIPVRSIEDVTWTGDSNSVRVVTPDGKTRVIDVTRPSDTIGDQIDQGYRDQPTSRAESLVRSIKERAPIIAAGAASVAAATDAAAHADAGDNGPVLNNQPKQNGATRLLNRLVGSPQATPPPKKDDVKEKAKEEVKQKARQEIKKQVVKQGEKLAARIAARAAAMFALATSEIWLPILSFGVAIIAIAVMVGVGHSGIFGSSFHLDSDKNTELTALANGGDVFARRQLDAQDIPEILKAMDKVIEQANAKKPQDNEASEIANKVKTLISTYTSNDGKVDQNNLDTIRTYLDQLSAKGYSGVAASEIGIKIAKLAYYYAGTQEGQQKYQVCSIEDKTACNAFVIKVMHETGADTQYEGRAYDQYLYTKKNTTCYESFTVTNASQLAQGDIVFRPRTIRGIGHVAIYIGNGRIAAASLHDHNPRVGRWYSDLSAAARLKGGVCAAKAQ